MLILSQLYIYPVKSMGGISVSSAWVTERGLERDRRWMLVDKENSFLTLRELPKMAMLQPVLEEKGLRIRSLEYPADDLMIPFDMLEKEWQKVTIWNATCDVRRVGEIADRWFSEILETNCKLVYMPDESIRPVDTTSGYKPEGKITSFSDAYPFMMLGEASLHDLNTRLTNPVSFKRFRPNIVFSGGYPYQEDEITEFTINRLRFTGLENCARCSIPNVDPKNGIMGPDKEPLRTLASYRTQNRKVNFGRNVVHTGTGRIKIGDEVCISN